MYWFYNVCVCVFRVKKNCFDFFSGRKVNLVGTYLPTYFGTSQIQKCQVPTFLNNFEILEIHAQNQFFD